ncbi:PTS sugar transporter subunit IIA [Streptococcus sp. 263_SSPC]|uniref:PTS sugar transporter subunit IIA n=1 Tax=Streptococcus sp. 263_SSPC TaxID=1579343 RepID=UPI000661877E|nr:PTS sugar transporter subunit IIA [Streptococcus sp. 263_SSPC]
MLREIIENGRFSFQKGSLSWEEAIKKACQPLLEQKIIEPEYPGYIISNVHEFGPYIVIAPEICIPHAQEGKGVNDTAVAFMNVEEAVDFGPGADYQPHLFFVLASTDNEKHLNNLSELVTLLDDETIINAFVEARSKEDLEKILKGIGE